MASRARRKRRAAFEIVGQEVPAGRRVRVDVPVARLPIGNWISLPIEVIHGRRAGPVLWLSAAIHGDELNGIAIIRRLLQTLTPKNVSGTVIAVPIVNVFGVMNGSRYLPDRRDLNRSFPGSARGSMAARLAYLLMNEVVARSQYGIDLHTGSAGRENLPQIRANLELDETRRCAEAFAAPVLMHANERAGSLRAEAVKRGACVILYEAGEALRFDSRAIATGVAGSLRVLGELGMYDEEVPPAVTTPVTVSRSSWVRVSRSGLLEVSVELGDRVTAGQPLATIGDTFGTRKVEARAAFDGIVIGLTHNPIVNRGDAVVHVAAVS